MKLHRLTIIILLSLMASHHSQSSRPVKIVTYNVENLFDTKHDSHKEDSDFLPESVRHWTSKRFHKKVHEVMQVIVNIGDNAQPPMLVGLCEVENDYVLQTMTKFPPYDQLGYDYIHFESHDRRGIDVALLYQPSLFTPLASRPIEVVLPNGSKGREILYVCGQLNDGTLLHVFEVHFPSRREGAITSQPNRVAAATVLKNTIDSIQSVSPDAGIIIMGDFNDNPTDYVPASFLRALPYNIITNPLNSNLYNLAWDGSHADQLIEGTYFHGGNWDMLDQIIVSGSLLNGSLPIRIANRAKVFKPDWISDHNQNGTEIPKRTYLGTAYQGGVSDHFPLYVTAEIEK